MMMPSTVSVAITTYQRPEGAKRAINSAISQDYPLAEILLIEDGPESELKQWLEAVGDPRLRYISHGRNRGLSAARNTALTNTRSGYLAYLDDDDWWKTNRISEQIKLIYAFPEETRTQLGVVSCGCEIRATNNVLLFLSSASVRGEIREQIIKTGLRTVPSSFLFQTSALRRVGGFDETLKSSIDHDIWMALADAGYHADFVDEPLVVTYHHKRKKSMVSNTTPRIAGVTQFVAKWTPTYQRWLGPSAGSIYADRYFIYVVARLAVSKLFEGYVIDFAQCISSIWRRGNQRKYATLFILREIFRHTVRAVLPHNVRTTLSTKYRYWRRLANQR